MSERERIFRPTKGLNPHYAKEFLEVREGDPKDLDTLLKAIDRKFPGVVMARLPRDAQEWIQQVVNARHGEGGE